MKNRFHKITTVLQEYSLGNFNKKLTISPKLDEVDAFMAGINMLGEELKETTISKNYFTNIFDSISEMVFIVNKKGIIINYNKSVKKYFNSKAEHLTNVAFDDFFVKSNRPLFKELTTLISKNKTYAEIEIDLFLKPQKKVYLLLSITNLFNRNNKNVGYIITAKDISLQHETNIIIIRTIVETQEKERLRVSQDIHDSLGQQLSSLKFYLGTSRDLAKDDEVKNILIKANNALIAIQSEMRNICFDLMPKSLETAGLMPALKELFLQINLNTGLQFKITGNISPTILSKPIETALFRIVQEFINNSLKYAKASLVTFKIKYSNQILSILLSDNGLGFKVEHSKKNGMGLQNIQSRVAAYKGSISITSIIGAGTTYKISIPIND
jgi:PAS domain S-box-containing protein